MTHIKHPYEDRELTVGSLCELAAAVALGTAKDVTEKLDGVSLMYTCTARFEPRAARNMTDVKAGGMHHSVLDARFTGRGVVQDTFNNGFAAIRRFLLDQPSSAILKACNDGQTFFTAEILYSRNPNVVRYDTDTVVLHSNPVITRTTEKVTTLSCEQAAAAFAPLEKGCDGAQSQGWVVRGPCKVALQELADLNTLDTFTRAAEAWGDQGESLQDCLLRRAEVTLRSMGLVGGTLEAAAGRLSERDGSATLTQLRSRVSGDVYRLLKGSDDWVSATLRPLELAVAEFGAAVAAGVKPTLLSDHQSQVERVRQKLSESVALVKASPDPRVTAYAKPHLEKLASVERFQTAVEGIVVPWRGALYKFTGMFAPANALMGLCKYGLGKAVPPVTGR